MPYPTDLPRSIPPPPRSLNPAGSAGIGVWGTGGDLGLSHPRGVMMLHPGVGSSIRGGTYHHEVFGSVLDGPKNTQNNGHDV